MTHFKKLLIAAAAMTPIAIATALPAQAQVAGVAVADPDAAILGTTAWKTAATQIQATYKPQIDQATARAKVIQAELDPMITAFETASKVPNANQVALRTQFQAIQTKENAGNAEIGRITAPVQRARAFAVEQISAQLGAAVTTVTTAKKVQIVLRPAALLFAAPATDITADITTELNRLIPSVSITPPANWQPGQRGTGAPPPAPAPAPAPTGR